MLFRKGMHARFVHYDVLSFLKLVLKLQFTFQGMTNYAVKVESGNSAPAIELHQYEATGSHFELGTDCDFKIH